MSPGSLIGIIVGVVVGVGVIVLMFVIYVYVRKRELCQLQNRLTYTWTDLGKPNKSTCVKVYDTHIYLLHVSATHVAICREGHYKG